MQFYLLFPLGSFAYVDGYCSGHEFNLMSCGSDLHDPLLLTECNTSISLQCFSKFLSLIRKATERESTISSCSNRISQLSNVRCTTTCGQSSVCRYIAVLYSSVYQHMRLINIITYEYNSCLEFKGLILSIHIIIGPPSRPCQVESSQTSCDSISISWTFSKPVVDSYYIRYRPSNIINSSWIQLKELNTNMSTTAIATISNIDLLTSYEVTLHGSNEYGNGPLSDPIIVSLELPSEFSFTEQVVTPDVSFFN